MSDKRAKFSFIDALQEKKRKKKEALAKEPPSEESVDELEEEFRDPKPKTDEENDAKMKAIKRMVKRINRLVSGSKEDEDELEIMR